MDKFPVFSVVVPVCGAAKTLRRAAGSLFSQDFADWEAVFVDDGSPDDSAEIIGSLMDEDPRCRLVRHGRNLGTHMARKTGVAAARGEWILFLDPDDEFAPGLLSRLLMRISASPVDLLRFDFSFRDRESVDPSLRGFHDEQRCSGASCHGPGCALPVFFFGKNASCYLWTFACRASVCKAAFAATEDSRLVHSEDIYELFALASFANSYGEERFNGYWYDFGTGGITRWRTEKGRNREAYISGYFANLGARLESFAALARFARAFRGPRARAVRRAMRLERRRVLAGAVPWEISELTSMGLPRREALRRARPAFAALERRDRIVLFATLALRALLERLRLLPV